jgi:uncharacterized protein (DUF2236 family)
MVSPGVTFDVSAYPGDHGWFGPESATWAVFRDRTPLIAAIRALWLQALHPSVLEAVLNTSGFRDQPVRRLQRTVEWLTTIVYASDAEAAKACERLNTVHGRIQGVRRDGTEYRADDPELTLWVHCTLVDSLLVCSRMFGEAAIDEDDLVGEWSRVARALGVSFPPEDVDELAEAMRCFMPALQSDELTKRVVQSVEQFQVPAPLRGVLRAVCSMAQSSLTPWQRELCGFRYQEAAGVGVQAVRLYMRVKPSRVARAALMRTRLGAVGETSR